MPSYKNAPNLANQLNLCDKELNALFADVQQDRELRRLLYQVQSYYRRSFN